MSVHTILLDLDGTLTDPKIGITTCIRYGLEKVGHPISDDTDLDWCIGPPLHASLEQLLPPEHKHLAAEALAGYRERFGEIGLFENEVYPDVATTLKTLQQQGYQLMLATAKPTVYAKRILEHFDLAPYFSAIHGSELDGTRTNKGELIAYILQTHDLSANTCIMVGDREFDVLGARANDMPVIGVSYGYGSAAEWQQSPADVQIEAFAELLDALPRFQDA